jgi:hypothetical protein
MSAKFKKINAQIFFFVQTFGHNRNALSVDCAQISVFEKANQVSFGSFLKLWCYSTGIKKENVTGKKLFSEKTD